MLVRASDLAGKNHLESRIQALRHLRGASKSRILQNQHAALGLLGRDQAASLDQQRAQVVELPEHRHTIGPRLGGDQFAEHFPQWGGVLFVEPLVEFLPRRGNFGRDGGRFSFHMSCAL